MDWLRESIAPPDDRAAGESRARWNAIAKPIGSLGLMESAVERIAGLTGDAGYRIDKRALTVFCADNGVVRQGVSQAGSDVTQIMARGLATGDTSVCHMARAARVDVFPLDVGMNREVEGVSTRKMRRGTDDMSQGSAMTRADALEAIGAGGGLVQDLYEKGYRIIATGEMGIGNTTSSGAMAAALLGRGAEEVTGRGAGLSGEGLRNKVAVIQRALEVNEPEAGDALDVLCKVGGLDIAAMTGAFLAGAVLRVPVVIDGLISAVAALTAARLRPEARCAMLASHVSAEPAAKWVLDALELKPMIHAEMRLGEGTGAVAFLPLLDAAYAVYHGMGTFGDMNIESYKALQ